MNATYLHQKLKDIIKSPTPHFGDGLTKGQFQLSGLVQRVKDYTQEMPLKRCSQETHPNKPRKKLRMQESAVHTKKKILIDKSRISEPISLPIASSPTSHPALTSNAGACKPFWNSHSQDLSRRLWLCTGTDWQDSALNCLKPSSKRLAENSWFSAEIKRIPRVNSQKTYLPLQPSLWRAITGPEVQSIVKDEKQSMKPPPGKAFKIRLYPTQQQKKILKCWVGTARWTYNQCVQSIKTKQSRAAKKDLRALHLNREGVQALPLWVLETPYDVRDEAMNDVLKAIKTNFAAKRTHFELKFRSRKDASQGIAVLSKHWGRKRGVYAGVFNNQAMKSAERLPDKLEYDSRLVVNKLGEWYLCVPLPLSVSENQAPIDEEWTDGVIALDPGVRTFVTGYDPSGMVCEWGKNDIGRIVRLCHVLDKLHSKWSGKDVRHRRRYRLKRAGRKIRKRVRNLVDEFHKKLSKWLCENYRVILLPVFKTQGMIVRGQRKIGSRTVRSMVTWSHYRFQQRLISKTREYPWCKVVLCDESYTSKTCTRCGVLNNSLGGSKVFKCGSCGLVLDRDVNGARNILLRFLSV